MFSYCSQERDAQGREVIELGMNEKRVKFSIVAVPIVFVIVMYFVMDLPLIMAAFGLILFPVIFAGVGFQFLGGIAEQTALRVTLDSKAGRILVASASGQSAIRMVEVAKAEFGSSISTSTSSDGTTRQRTVYRLEFVKKDGERVPATAAYSSIYSLADQGTMVAAVNAALGRQMV